MVFDLRPVAFLMITAFAGSMALAASQGNPAKGAKVFEKATCAGCHPGGGNAMNPQKPLHGPAFAAKYKDDAQLVKVIRCGIKNSAMPPFSKDMVSDVEMKDLVAYLRSLIPGKATK